MFIEANCADKFERSRQELQAIVLEHMQIKDSYWRSCCISDLNPFPGPHSAFAIPSVYTEAIVGPFGNTIKLIF